MATSPRSSRPRLDQAAADAGVEVVPWSEVAGEFVREWGQGQHLVTLGRTGLGKSTFSFACADLRQELRGASVCTFVNKRRDDTAKRQRWPIIQDWPPTYAMRRARKVMLWPRYTKASTYPKDAAPIFREALDEIMEEGNWTLYLDEASYLVESMGLRTSIDELFTQSRSNGITLIAGSQRPVWVSRAMVSQHSWVACFKIGDQDDARRAGEVIGDRNRFAPVVHTLDRHQFLLINSVSGEGVISQVGT